MDIVSWPAGIISGNRLDINSNIEVQVGLKFMMQYFNGVLIMLHVGMKCAPNMLIKLPIRVFNNQWLK